MTFVTKDSYLCVLGHGPATTALLHQLESQHLPHRATVRGSVVGGDVQTGEILAPGPELQIRSWSYWNKFGEILRDSKFSKRKNLMQALVLELSTFQPMSWIGEFPPYSTVSTFCFDRGWGPHW